MATTLLKVYTLTVFDSLSRYHRGVELHVYVDDVDLYAAHSCPRAAYAALAQAANFLLTTFENALLLQVACHKCVLLASNITSDRELRDRMRRWRPLARVTVRSWGQKARGAV